MHTSAGAAPMMPKAVASVMLCAAFFASLPAIAADNYARIGRRATPSEIAAWDIDVRPDFAGLPAGAGSVAQGEKLWESKCASCHGAFGESPAVFPPLIGGTTKADIERGRVTGLTAITENAKTTFMKVANVSTLWDYIRRAMPFDKPKSLTVDEVYAATAYLLHLADIVPRDFTLSDKTIAQAQARMPNRDGMSTAHGMFDVNGKPDVRSEACMNNCRVNESSLVVLPPTVNGLNGNLADQNRNWGPVRGVDTGRRK
jgi:cytochrome c